MAPVFPIANPPAGQPDYSSNGTTSMPRFIPEVWSGKLQVKFYKSTVLSEITNNDWEGEIKSHGDKVVIRQVPDIAVADYQKGLPLIMTQPTANSLELLIDHGKYFAVILDDVNAVQSDLKLMDNFTNDAAEQMKIKIDADVLNYKPGAATPRTAADRWSTAVLATSKGDAAGIISGKINLGKNGAPLVPSNAVPAGSLGAASCNPLDIILRAGLVLDEQNCPETGRWIVLPSWMGLVLKTSDLKAVYVTGDPTTPLRTGKIGTIDRFTIYLSNNYDGSTLPADVGKVAPCEALFGCRDAISFASQITNVETLRSQTTFGNIVRGLNVYGYKDTKPEAMGVVYIAQA
jgi:hypothetical protein